MYGPHTTVYNRFNRWSKAGIWQRMLDPLVEFDRLDSHAVDSTSSKAHRCAAGGKGGSRRRQSGAVAADGRPKSTPLSMTLDA